MYNFLFFKSDRACLFPSPKTPNPTARTREIKILLRAQTPPKERSRALQRLSRCPAPLLIFFSFL